MFSALRHRTAALALGVCFILPVHASSPKPGDFANTQARHIATFFPGRMTGTPAEMLSADYIRQQFQQMGYRSDVRTFNSRYIYTARDNRKSWHNVTGSTVIAAHEGKAPQQIIIMAHLDTYAPLSDADADANLGGLTLQGMDDNAAGLGVMLELAEHLKNTPTEYGIRFVATSGEEEGKLGAENLLKRMSDTEKKNTLLVINLDNLIVGDKLYFNSGVNTPEAVRKLTRDRALAIARSHGIAATTNPGLNKNYPKGTGCCNDAEIFDKAGIAGDQTITIQYAGFYPAWWLLLRFVSENCLKLHTTFSDTQLTQRVAYHQRESQYCTTQYDDCHKGIFCQHVLPPCKEETNIRIA